MFRLKLIALLGLLTLTTAQLVPVTSPPSVVGCVSDATTYCNKHTWPVGSPEYLCTTVADTTWSDPMSQMRSKCYCGRKDVQTMWWNCYYQAVALCPRDQGTMREIWQQEWEVHRYQRRLYCLDDFKPTPPWHLIDNDYMKMHYDTKRPNQYSYDFAKFKKRGTAGPSRSKEMIKV